MPLLKIHTLDTERAWGLWQITESEDELATIAAEACPEEIVHPLKRLEWLTGRALIKAVLHDFGLHYFGLTKDEYGKPMLNDHVHQVSLSHSYPFVVAQIDRLHAVGIDVEQPKEKLRKVGPRLFSVIETADAGDDIIKLCIYWCAKEALYKIHGKRNILFSDHLEIQPFVRAGEGNLIGRIRLPEHETVAYLKYLVSKDFVLVYTTELPS